MEVLSCLDHCPLVTGVGGCVSQRRVSLTTSLRLSFIHVVSIVSFCLRLHMSSRRGKIKVYAMAFYLDSWAVLACPHEMSFNISLAARCPQMVADINR